MKTIDAAYYMEDNRTVPADSSPLHPIVALFPIPGGIEIRSLLGTGFVVIYPDNDDDNDDTLLDLPDGEIQINVPEGQVLLHMLTHANYGDVAHTVSPNFTVPNGSDAALQKLFYGEILKQGSM